jgi:hypothetical protein
MRSLTQLGAALVALIVVGNTVAPTRAAAQMLQGLRSEWGDLETWTRAIESSRESELGLGLQLNGSAGTTLVAFMGRLSARDPRTPPRDLDIQVGTHKMTNPNLLRRPSLTFLMDEGTDKRKSVDLGPSLKVDDPSPGAIISDGIARIDAADFLAMANAKKIKGNVFGFDVTLRSDQIAAIRALAERLQMKLDR